MKPGDHREEELFRYALKRAVVIPPLEEFEHRMAVADGIVFPLGWTKRAMCLDYGEHAKAQNSGQHY